MNTSKTYGGVRRATPPKILCRRENGSENHAKTRCFEVQKKHRKQKKNVETRSKKTTVGKKSKRNGTKFLKWPFRGQVGPIKHQKKQTKNKKNGNGK